MCDGVMDCHVCNVLWAGLKYIQYFSVCVFVCVYRIMKYYYNIRFNNICNTEPSVHLVVQYFQYPIRFSFIISLWEAQLKVRDPYSGSL